MSYCNIRLKKLRALKFAEKRTFRVETVPMTNDEIVDYLKKRAAKYGKNAYDENGRINYRFNILGNDEDIWIPVRSNTVAFQ